MWQIKNIKHQSYQLLDIKMNWKGVTLEQKETDKCIWVKFKVFFPSAPSSTPRLFLSPSLTSKPTAAKRAAWIWQPLKT